MTILIQFLEHKKQIKLCEIIVYGIIIEMKISI